MGPGQAIMSNNDCCVRIRDVDAGMRHTQHLTLEWPVNFTGHATPPPSREAPARYRRGRSPPGSECCAGRGGVLRGVRQRRGDDWRRGRAEGPEAARAGRGRDGPGVGLGGPREGRRGGTAMLVAHTPRHAPRVGLGGCGALRGAGLCVAAVDGEGKLACVVGDAPEALIVDLNSAQAPPPPLPNRCVACARDGPAACRSAAAEPPSPHCRLGWRRRRPLGVRVSGPAAPWRLGP